MRRKKKMMSSVKEILLSISGFAAILLIWYLLVTFTSVGRLIPAPLKVLERIIYTMQNPVGRVMTLPGHLLVSLKRVLTGFGLAAFLGIVIGIAMGRSDIIKAIIRPLFEIVRPIPGVAWIPLSIVWFGIGETAKIYIIFISGFVNIVVNTFAGAKQVDNSILNVAYMLGASKFQTFLRVVIPYCVPYIFSGLQVGLSTCWMAVLAAEMVSATEGIGWVITAGQQNGDMTQIFVGIIAIAVTGLALAAVMRAMEHILCRWRVRGS